jgi:hypothetical protein
LVFRALTAVAIKPVARRRESEAQPAFAAKSSPNPKKKTKTEKRTAKIYLPCNFLLTNAVTQFNMAVDKTLGNKGGEGETKDNS